MITKESIKRAKAHYQYGINHDMFSADALEAAKTSMEALSILDNDMTMTASSIISSQEEEIEELKKEIELLRAFRRKVADAIVEELDRYDSSYKERV